MNARKTASLCPCGSGMDYVDCCGAYIDHPERAAPTAEALMRSRYTAYTRLNEPYLLQTWHPDSRPEALDLAGEVSLKWLGLDVLRVAAGAAGDLEGMVEFQARYRTGGGPAMRIHESSHFLFVDGRWYYCDGEVFE